MGSGAAQPPSWPRWSRGCAGAGMGRGRGRITLATAPSHPGAVPTRPCARRWPRPRVSGSAHAHPRGRDPGREIGLMLQRTGFRHIEWLAALGGVRGRTCNSYTASMSVRMSRSGGCKRLDRRALPDQQHVPRLWHRAGAQAMRRRGIPIALGTDGSARSNSQDPGGRMKTAILLAKIGSGDMPPLSCPWTSCVWSRPLAPAS